MLRRSRPREAAPTDDESDADAAPGTRSGGMQTTSPRREGMVRFAAAFIALAASFVGITANAQPNAAAQPIVLLDFWSPHCGPCMQMKPIVHALEQARYPIRQIDTTQDFQTSRQFNVNQIPCFVMLVNGREVERQVGATSSESLQQMFERAKDEVQRSSNIRLKDRDPSPVPDSPQSRGPVSIPPPSLHDQAVATTLDPPAMRGAPE